MVIFRLYRHFDHFLHFNGILVIFSFWGGILVILDFGGVFWSFYKFKGHLSYLLGFRRILVIFFLGFKGLVIL